MVEGRKVVMEKAERVEKGSGGVMKGMVEGNVWDVEEGGA